MPAYYNPMHYGYRQQNYGLYNYYPQQYPYSHNYSSWYSGQQYLPNYQYAHPGFPSDYADLLEVALATGKLAPFLRDPWMSDMDHYYRSQVYFPNW